MTFPTSVPIEALLPEEGETMPDTIYNMLKRAGHSPSKAAEILLDASRGDELALTWIRGVAAMLEDTKP